MKAKVNEKTILVGGREEKRRALAICDSELLGKKFEEGEAVLDLQTYRSFYDGEEVGEEKAVEMIREAASVNLVGEKTIAAAKKALKLRDESVQRIAGVPHLQIYRV